MNRQHFKFGTLPTFVCALRAVVYVAARGHTMVSKYLFAESDERYRLLRVSYSLIFAASSVRGSSEYRHCHGLHAFGVAAAHADRIPVL